MPLPPSFTVGVVSPIALPPLQWVWSVLLPFLPCNGCGQSLFPLPPSLAVGVDVVSPIALPSLAMGVVSIYSPIALAMGVVSPIAPPSFLCSAWDTLHPSQQWVWSIPIAPPSLTVGAAVGLSVGDEVAGLLPLDSECPGCAEYSILPEYCLLLKPATVSHTDCAAALRGGLMAYTALHHQTRLEPGAIVLVCSAMEGERMIILQLCDLLGAKVSIKLRTCVRMYWGLECLGPSAKIGKGEHVVREYVTLLGPIGGNGEHVTSWSQCKGGAIGCKGEHMGTSWIGGACT